MSDVIDQIKTLKDEVNDERKFARRTTWVWIGAAFWQCACVTHDIATTTHWAPKAIALGFAVAFLLLAAKHWVKQRKLLTIMAGLDSLAKAAMHNSTVLFDHHHEQIMALLEDL